MQQLITKTIFITHYTCTLWLHFTVLLLHFCHKIMINKGKRLFLPTVQILSVFYFFRSSSIRGTRVCGKKWFVAPKPGLAKLLNIPWSQVSFLPGSSTFDRITHRSSLISHHSSLITHLSSLISHHSSLISLSQPLHRFLPVFVGRKMVPLFELPEEIRLVVESCAVKYLRYI